MNTSIKHIVIAIVVLLLTTSHLIAQNPNINVYIDLDGWEDEVTWTLTGPGFSQSGGPYVNGDDIIDLTYPTTQFGSYTFTINDSYGDGLSDNSSGTNENSISSYQISVNGSAVYISSNMPDYGYQDVQTFDILDSDGDGVSDAYDIDDDNDGIMDVDENTCQTGQFLNGDFEDVLVNVSTYVITSENNIPGWETTASDNMIEIWNSGFNGVPAYSGSKFAEIDANMRAKMFQTLDVLPGDVVTWKVAHRGRSGTDVMHIMVGPTGSPVSQQIASTGNTAWQVYTNNYTVPNNIYQIEIGFEAISSSGGVSYGNFIDDIELYIISTDACDVDGDGIPNYLDIDSDNDGITDVLEAGGSDPDGDGRLGTGAITDTDGDGLSDLVDTDNGGTALTNPDTDGDGLHNMHDIDSDDDGIIDMIESQTTSGYTTGSGSDTDNDGLDDTFDGNNGGTYIYPLDSDGDGTPDYIDLDSDDDGDSDWFEVFDIDNDGIADTNPSYLDNDGDGLDNAFDSDGTSTTNNGGSDNNNQIPGTLPNNDGGAPERDWREPNPDGSGLPIELLSFTANKVNSIVEINWVTVNEIDNDYFTIERSQDGIHFELLTTINGAGTSVQELDYFFIDSEPLKGISYYRLKQTDFNGDFTYSSIETVVFENNMALEITKVYPNPFKGHLQIEFVSNVNETMVIQVFNMQGQEIYQIQINALEGANSVMLEGHNQLASGIYYIRLKGANSSSSPLKVVKQ